MTTLAVAELILTAVALVVLSPLLAAAATVGVPLGVVAARWYLRRGHGVYRAERERAAEVTAALHESASGAATVAAHRLGPARLALLRAAGAAAFTASMRGTAIRNVLNTGVVLGQVVAQLALLATGAVLLDAGRVSLGEVGAAAFYLLRLTPPLRVLWNYLSELQTAAAGTAVSLRGVHFGYLSGRPVLHGIDLDIPTGQRLALVGPNGAGKSTLAALIVGTHRHRPAAAPCPAHRRCRAVGGRATRRPGHPRRCRR